jgi:hypothetical protein
MLIPKRPKVLTSKEMHRATIADPNPISKTMPMKIAQTVRPGYPFASLNNQNSAQTGHKP